MHGREKGTYLIYQNKCTSAMNNPLKETLLSLSTFRGCIKISYHPADLVQSTYIFIIVFQELLKFRVCDPKET